MNSTTASTSNAYVYKVTSVESSTGNSAAKVGYSFVRYGTTSKEKAQTNTNDSAVKEKVDEWYESHIKGTEYESYLSDTLFCNDRSLTDTLPSGYTNLGYGTEKTAYRWYDYSMNQGVTLNCKQQNDRFTVNDETIGNGDLTYPIGLLTTDEAFLAGGYSSANSNYYLHTGNNNWTMSPVNFTGFNAAGRTIYISGHAYDYGYVDTLRGVRPVINLKPNSLKQGDGTASNPYCVE